MAGASFRLLFDGGDSGGGIAARPIDLQQLSHFRRRTASPFSVSMFTADSVVHCHFSTTMPSNVNAPLPNPREEEESDESSLEDDDDLLDLDFSIPRPYFRRHIYYRLNNYFTCWQGHVSLRGTSVQSRIIHVQGPIEFTIRALQSMPTIQLTRKIPMSGSERSLEMRQPTDDFLKKISNEQEYSVLVLAPDGKDPVEVEKNASSMANSIISYFFQSIPSYAVVYSIDGDISFMVHFFPPSIWSNRKVVQHCPDLEPMIFSCGVMLGIITAHFTGNLVTYNPGAKYRAIK